jgi:ribonuclease HI
VNGERRLTPDALVERIRRETGRAVPDVDPAGAGTAADVLVVLRDPGRGALASEHISLTNRDPTTANQIRLFAAADLSLDRCVWWNAFPWSLERQNPTPGDRARGARYLRDLFGVMQRSPVVVACGNDAHDVCDRAGIAAIKICHPSPRGLRGGGANREPAYIAGLQEAARRIGGEAPDTSAGGLKKGYYLLFIDGGIRANDQGQTEGAIGVILREPGCGRVLATDADTVESVGSPLEAEYHALIRGLKLAAEKQLVYVAAFSDSRNLVNQVTGRWNKNEQATKLHEEVEEALKPFTGWQISWLPREMNKEADKLVNQAFGGSQ